MAVDSEQKSISSWMHLAFGLLPATNGAVDAGDSEVLLWTFADLGGEVTVSQQAVIHYESLKGIAQQGTIGYEARGLTLVSSQAVIHYESLRRILQQAGIPYEALQRIRSQGVIGYEIRGVPLRISQIHIIEALFPDVVVIDVKM